MADTNKCFDYKYEKNSGGTPVMRRQCYCGTTACLNQYQQIVKILPNWNVSVPTADVISSETEKAFYEKVFDTPHQ